MILRPPLIVILSILLGLGSSTCQSRRTENTDRLPIGPNVAADLVIYFKADTTDEQINAFWQEVLSRPHPEGRGYYNRDGIRDILSVFTPVQGHEAVAVTFSPNSTPAQRKEVKEAITSSPIVYKVLENVAPADVKSID